MTPLLYTKSPSNSNKRKRLSKAFDKFGFLPKVTRVEYMKSNANWFFVFVLSKPKAIDDILYG